MGKYSALWFCIVPPFGRANTATLELNISPYCPLTNAITYIHIYIYIYIYIFFFLNNRCCMNALCIRFAQKVSGALIVIY